VARLYYSQPLYEFLSIVQYMIQNYNFSLGALHITYMLVLCWDYVQSFLLSCARLPAAGIESFGIHANNVF
jgi:hypothetical protein